MEYKTIELILEDIEKCHNDCSKLLKTFEKNAIVVNDAVNDYQECGHEEDNREDHIHTKNISDHLNSSVAIFKDAIPQSISKLEQCKLAFIESKNNTTDGYKSFCLSLLIKDALLLSDIINKSRDLVICIINGVNKKVDYMERVKEDLENR
jgi:hypothetical protein